GISMKKKRVTKDALDYLHERFFAGDPERLRALEEEREKLQIGLSIYKFRNKAKLSQSELAALVGTSTSVISRLEDADYEGHSLSMLLRIASALNRRLDIRFL